MLEIYSQRVDNTSKKDKETRDGYYQPSQWTDKTHPGRAVPDIPGMQCSGNTNKACIAAPWIKTLGSLGVTEEGAGSTPLCFCRESPREEEKQWCSVLEGTPSSLAGAGGCQGGPGGSGPRISLVKKKSELGLKGPLKGHFKKEIREAVVKAIKEAMDQGLTQAKACNTVGLSPRKFRRWANPKPLYPRKAWNRILPEERNAIIDTAWDEKFLGKPLSHLYVYGHESRRYCVSLSTLYNVLSKEKVVRPKIVRKGHQRHIDAHQLLEEGFYLVCYDATRFVTDANVGVWAIPVLLLPYRYLLYIGHTLHSVRSSDLINTVEYACNSIPESMASNLLAYSDRGGAMKSHRTKDYFIKNLNLPVYFGRPHTPDDEAWIEAFIKTLKYHREAPSHFPQVADVADWLNRFPSIYNQEPHSSLGYVTPAQALAGLKEVILNRRKQNLYEAKEARLAAYRATKSYLPEVVEIAK